MDIVIKVVFQADSKRLHKIDVYSLGKPPTLVKRLICSLGFFYEKLQPVVLLYFICWVDKLHYSEKIVYFRQCLILKYELGLCFPTIAGFHCVGMVFYRK